MKDSPRRLLCGFLALIFVFNMLPLNVLAEQAEELQADATVEPVTSSEEVYVVEEIVENRTEYAKEFQLSNGLRLASVYSEPVHFDIDGEWEEIDNTLRLDNARSENAYTNTAGEWQVSFPQNLTKTNGVTISKDGFSLNFRMTGEIRASNTGTPNTEIMSATEPMSIESAVDDQSDAGFATLSVSAPSEVVTAAIDTIDMSEMRAVVEYPEVVADKNASRLRYENIYENTDIVFDLVSNRVKESVVLKAYCASLYGYSYELNTGEMVPVLLDNGAIELKNPENEQTVMHMPAPFLVDDAGVVSSDVDVSLTGSDGTYTLTYTLPQEWLAEENRQWPVVLDPIVSYVSSNSTAEDETFYQMYESSSDGSIMNCGYKSGIGCARTFLKFTDLPNLTSADVIVSAGITLAACIKDGTAAAVVEVRGVTESWSENDSKILWDYQPNFSDTVEDFAYCTTEQVLTWEITDLVRSWYTGNNYGMVFKLSDANEAAKVTNYISFHTPLIYAQPALTIVYRNNNGLESYWDYTTSSAGRAGTGYVNQYTGNLVWVHDDIGFGGNRMPVTISHIYNANDTLKKDFGMGYGWRTNFNQKVSPLNSNYYVWVDADGTSHYFLKSDTNKYKDEDGLELTLTTNGTDASRKYAITDKYGNASYFDSSGRLSAQENNQQVKSSISVTYTSGGLISKITDGVGRVYNFTYNNNLLSKISYVGTGTSELSKVSFGYSDSNLTSITYADGSQTKFTYSTSTRLLLTAQDVDGYRLTYAYALGVPRRVSTIKESYLANNSTETYNGSTLNFKYAHNQTTLTDHNGNLQIVQFNSWGNTISIQDDQGRAQYAQYALNDVTDSSSDNAKGNQLKLSSKMQNTVGNLLDNGGFENPTSWWSGTSNDVTVARVNEDSHWEDYSLKITRTSSGTPEGITTPMFAVHQNTAHTFSAYVKTGTASVYLQYNGDDGTVEKSEVLPPNSDWTRVMLSFTTNDVVSNAQIKLLSENAGTFYMDSTQFERFPAASRCNLIENGDFKYGTFWSSTAGRTTAANAGITKASAPQLDGNIYKMTGSATEKRRISQTVTVDGQKGDTYVLAGWAKGNSAPLYDHDGSGTKLTATEFAIIATVYYTDSTKGVFKAQFNPDMDMTNDWQYSSTAIVAEKAYSSMLIELVYDYNINTAYFDGIQLFKEEFGSSYTYDEEGNVVSVTDLQAQKTTYEYKNNDLTKQVLPNGATYEYEYDAHHNVIKAKTGTGLEYEFTYDDYGNNTSVSISSGDTALISYADYSDDGNRLESTTDAAGNVTTYEYDADTNVLNWVKYPKDSNDSKTNYEYDAMYRLAEANMAVSTDQILSANYTYTDDLLTSVQTGSTTYQFTYGNFSLRDSIKIGSRILASYEYTEDRNNYLSALDYGNDGRVEYTYDKLGRLTQQTYEDGDTVTYTYDNSGALIAVTDNATDITTTYYYDFIDRLMKYVEKGAGYTHSVGYGYDDLNNLSTLTDTINGTVSTTAYTYDSDNRVTSVGNTITRTENAVTETLADAERTYAYDDFSRVKQRVTKNGESAVITETLEYHEFDFTTADGDVVPQTSGQVTALTIDSADFDIVYEYSYDANGNITSVKVGTLETTYAYDAANQLIRENNPIAGKTWVWTYDNAGNIISRTEYDYTTDEPISSTGETVSYAYDKTWGDLLIGYGTDEIKSDTIGNMTSDGTWTYSWEHGRQLASMTDGTTTWTYTYNSDGLRTKRTNGSTTYSYVYTGSQLTQMTVGNSTLNFAYDASGIPMAVTYNGATYYYVTNLQGDVVALLNSSGTSVVNYTYDAWGNLLSTSGSMAATLGADNPLRYRGYVYDCETGLYYLQSRYYDPELGRFINADIYTSTGQGLLGNNMFAYCNNNPVRYIDSNGKIPIDPSGDLGGWCGDLLASFLYAEIENEYGVTFRQLGAVFMDNIEATAGFGLGHYGGISFFEDIFTVAGGCKYDVFSCRYTNGEWRTGQAFYSGLEASMVGLYDAGEPTVLYNDSRLRMWEDSSSDSYFEFFGGGIYFFAGASYSIGINVRGFIGDLHVLRYN